MSVAPRCPHCQRPLLSRFAKLCSFCGKKLPDEILLSSDQRAAVERDEAAHRDLLAIQRELPAAPSSPPPLSPATSSPSRPPRWTPRFFPRERVDGFLALIGFPAAHPKYDRHITSAGLDETNWNVVLSESPSWFDMDWRTALDEALLPILARLENLGFSIAATFSPEGDRGTLRRGAQEVSAKYRPVDSDSLDSTIAGLNTLLRGEAQLRAYRRYEGTDSFAYLLLSDALWRRAEAEYPEFAADFRAP